MVSDRWPVPANGRKRYNSIVCAILTPVLVILAVLTITSVSTGWGSWVAFLTATVAVGAGLTFLLVFGPAKLRRRR